MWKIIIQGPCIIQSYQNWSLNKTFYQVASLVPEVSQMAKQVPRVFKIGKILLWSLYY